MNVCMLTTRFYPIIGGAEQQAQRLSRSLRTRGINAFVLTCRYRGLAADETIDGVPVHRFGTIYRRREPRGRIASLHMMAALSAALMRRRNRIDVVHVHGAGNAASVAVLTRPVIRKPVIVKIATASTRGTFEGDLFSVGRSPLGSARLAVLRRSDAFVATTEQIRAELVAWGVPERRVFMIPNGVDTERFRPASPGERARLRSERGVPQGAVALFVGRLVRRKGVDVLLRAWNDVVRDHPDATLLIAGSGEEEPLLRELARTLGLDARVRFLGTVDPEKLETYYAVSDLFVFPSRGEGMPNAILEAMSCGVPVAATSIGGVVDVVTDGVNGLLVPPDDHGAMARAVKRILSDGARTLGEGARRTVVERFSLDAVTDRCIAMYERLLRERGTVPTGDDA